MTGRPRLLIILTPVHVPTKCPHGRAANGGATGQEPWDGERPIDIEVTALGFLGRAKKMLRDLGTESPGRAQYFNVLCASGHRVRGERTEGYQALRCPACGEGVFVLPRSPLPEPVPPPGMAPRRARSARPRGGRVAEGPIELTDAAEGSLELELEGESAGLADDQIIWDDDPDAADNGSTAAGTAAPRVSPEDLAAAEIEAARRKEATASRNPGSSAARRAGASPAPAGRSRPAPAREPGRGAEARPSRPQPGADGQQGTARPTRPRPAPAASTGPGPIQAAPRQKTGPNVPLIFFLLGLLVLGAVGWRAWRYRREQLPRVVERGREEGIPALEEGDFDRANQLLSAARNAVDTLGGAVKDAEEIREAADEADLFVNLCPDKLEDLLARAGRSDPDAWQSEFDTLYKGRSCLFDTNIVSTPAEGGYEIAYIVFPPGEASRFGDGGLARPDRYARIDLEGFELFEQKAHPVLNAHVTFGAKIRSLDYDAAKKHWVIRLEPKSGRFIRHHKALEASGWPSADAAQVPTEDSP